MRRIIVRICSASSPRCCRSALVAGAVEQVPDLRALPRTLRRWPRSRAARSSGLPRRRAESARPQSASALHQRSPLAASAFLCVAGIVDLRAIVGRRIERRNATRSHWRSDSRARDGGIAARRCARPSFARNRNSRLRRDERGDGVAPAAPARRELLCRPALMLAGALVAVPPPAYRATETTLADAFPGEH